TNPNRASLEQCLAELEGGIAAACFSSGSAATMTLLEGVGAGHVIVPRGAYFGTIKLARAVFGPWGLELSLVDMTDPQNVARAMRADTPLAWVEPACHPGLEIA